MCTCINRLKFFILLGTVACELIFLAKYNWTLFNLQSIQLRTDIGKYIDLETQWKYFKIVRHIHSTKKFISVCAYSIIIFCYLLKSITLIAELLVDLKVRRVLL